ncbi:type 1 glutamine amidotransferase domain-containing protein [Methylopila turkensis]|uniref:Protease n=1 Tax=Methylopila turkensis TaxID=1437816 RepID=A0A9W6JPA6_9HYPH|nr:type 1 glutamine amidotransferase domain-containing protein [Methylopila turkensis]GLK79384.1 protease [Methylopila turkensis]
MANRLDGRKVAILATNGFEEIELSAPAKALRDAGAEVKVVSPEAGSIQGFQHDRPASTVPVDVTLDAADAGAFDALLIPGGLFNPDTLRQDEAALRFASAFFDDGKPVAAICHGPQVLISAGLVKGRRMTGYSAIQVDLKNAGADVSDEPVVVDQGLVTSRNPDDIPAFNAKIIEEFAEGRHSGQSRSAA